MEQSLLLLQHLIESRHRKGFGIHAPFAYNFVSEVIFGRDSFDYESLENLRKELSGSNRILEIRDMGAGGKRTINRNRSTGDLVRRTSVQPKKGRLLGRIAAYLDLPEIVELGTGTGFSSMYMGMAAQNTLIHTCEGSPGIAALAGDNIRKMGLRNIHVSCSDFRDWLPGTLDASGDEKMVFLDGDHRGERLLYYTGMILERSAAKTVMVIDDIHWSYDMNRAWKELISKEEVCLSFELFNLGIVYSSFPVQGGHYKIRF